jgi:hypothetical protein
MARQIRPISFDSFAAMAGHLDRWAANALTNPEQWQAALVDSHAWLDFAPRNQALLLSYEINGPAAGAETWRLVPSSEPGRPCAVRADEHGYPVRMPITTRGVEPDPFVGGTRPTRAVVERWEWRQVFSIDQLARRPGPGTLTPLVIPDELTGPDGTAAFTSAVTRVVTATVRGRLPKGNDPHRMLADAAGRLPRSADRPELIPTLREQVAWLVAERVGHADGIELPVFDPSQIKPRERWQRLVDVLDPARRLTASMGSVVGVDLVRSSIPRMQVVDDRTVPANRRHRLPAATLDGLPIGQWVTVGPYTANEWLARGELASGKGAFLRLNKTAYVVAVENGDQTGWRLEDVAARTGNGRLATGTSRSLDDARRDVVHALAGRYPAITTDTPLIATSLATTNRGGTMQLDHDIATLADSDTYSRDQIIERLGDRLTNDDRTSFISADPQQLAQMLGAAGITAATTVAVLHADGCAVDDIASLLPTLGVPMPSAIKVLNQRWDVPMVEAARMMSATGPEMREAGCNAAEILAYRPESVLERLPRDPHLWELAAGTMATTGHPPATVVSHLIQYAPTPECFAAGITTAIDDPATGLAIASQLRAQPDRLAATAERYGLAPSDTASVLRDVGAPATQIVATLGELCDYDDTAVQAAWRGETLDSPEVGVAEEVRSKRVTTIGGNEIGTAEELLACLALPGRTAASPPELFDLFSRPDQQVGLALEAAKR